MEVLQVLRRTNGAVPFHDVNAMLPGNLRFLTGNILSAHSTLTC
jgi:hypothetical protein